MQRLPCIWCAASSATGQRSAACLWSNLRRCIRLRSVFGIAEGNAVNAQLTPSGGISAASSVHLMRRIIGSRSEVSRLPASACGRICLRFAAASWRKCHQCPSNALQRHQCGGLLFIWCAASSAAGQRSAACLRSNSAAVHPSAVCVPLSLEETPSMPSVCPPAPAVQRLLFV